VPRNRRTTSCCGPFVQKLRRLAEVNAAIQQLLANQEAGRPVEPALTRALAEEKRLRSWIALHQHRNP
jgi:hypothetical protein